MRSLSVSFLLSFRKIVLGAAFALGMIVATSLGGGTAQAGVATPALGTSSIVLPATAPLTQNVRWVCGVWHCWWRPGWNYWYVPPYARAWGPPVRQGCFWRRTWGGGWVHVCP